MDKAACNQCRWTGAHTATGSDAPIERRTNRTNVTVDSRQCSDSGSGSDTGGGEAGQIGLQQQSHGDGDTNNHTAHSTAHSVSMSHSDTITTPHLAVGVPS